MTRIDGFVLYNCIVSGYEGVRERKRAINDINVFPVADGDTGNNMTATLYAMTSLDRVSRSMSRTLSALADRALSGARGNSGIIIAQFVNELAAVCGERDSMTAREFGAALSEASAATYGAMESPRDGTMITVLGAWAREMELLGTVIHDAERVFIEALKAAREALARTTEQLDELRKANVVDAGASGVVAFLEGIARMIGTGAIPNKAVESSELEIPETAHALLEGSDEPRFRYCTEALVAHDRGRDEARDAAKALITEALTGVGDSLVVVEGRYKTKVHVHTDEPTRVLSVLRSYGRVIEQKVDNMRVQYAAAHRPLSRTAILTDSIADIPLELVERHQIHVIPMIIGRGEEEYLDRLTVTDETFYALLETDGPYPASSIPDPRRIDQILSWLAGHYESIIAISVSSNLSGCWQAIESRAKKLRAAGFPIDVVDSRLNSGAQGLAVLSAAIDAEAGMTRDEILERLSDTIARARIFVSVATLRSMVRGGRVSPLKGFLATALNLKPIVSLDANGRGIALGASLSRKASLKKIVKRVRDCPVPIRHYAIVHANDRELADRLAKELEKALGIKPAYVTGISHVIALHAGASAVAVAYE